MANPAPKIPTKTGSGAVEMKVSLIADLLSSANPEEARYITRTIMEEMRIGVGEHLSAKYCTSILPNIFFPIRSVKSINLLSIL